ncbi:MAG: hypothetical protein HC845_10580 [Akkermansiaceae bacterium]|nr:hypothetical protein [Akkermansiaceae bacterium]
MSDTPLVFSQIPEIVAEFAAGRLVIVADDPHVKMKLIWSGPPRYARQKWSISWQFTPVA